MLRKANFEWIQGSKINTVDFLIFQEIILLLHAGGKPHNKLSLSTLEYIIEEMRDLVVIKFVKDIVVVIWISDIE